MDGLSRRRTLLLAVPPLALGLALLRPGAGRDPASVQGGEPDGSRAWDQTELRGAAQRQTPRAATSPKLLRRMVRVTDHAGTPLAAKVRVAFSPDGFNHVEILDLEPDATGRLPLELDPSAWVVLSVQAPGHVPRWQPPVGWAELQDSDLEFQLAQAARVQGASRWADGRPMSQVRLAFRPVWPPGEFAGQLASKLKIVDEELSTDESGRFSCESLRSGAYRVSFPEHPAWPALTLTADELATGTVSLRARWFAPAAK
jgi:hypothetical protein